jgi:hypothetical protein
MLGNHIDVRSKNYQEEWDAVPLLLQVMPAISHDNGLAVRF